MLKTAGKYDKINPIQLKKGVERAALIRVVQFR